MIVGVAVDDQRVARRTARRMVVLGGLAQNVMAGFAFAAFGTFVVPFEQRFAVDRSASTLPMLLMLAAMALTAQLLGVCLRRWSIRVFMIAGALMSAVGYGLLVACDSMTQVMWVYGLIIGPGSAMLGSMLPATLVSNWYDQGRGRALGLINIPLLVGVMPLLSNGLQQRLGLDAVFVFMSVGSVALVPLLMWVVDSPAKLGLLPMGAMKPPDAAAAAPAMASAHGTFMRLPSFWMLLSVGIVLAVTTTTIVVHIVPMTLSWGFSSGQAASLLSVLGFVGVLGSPFFGWLADRLGPVGALALNAAVQAAVWIGMTGRPPFEWMLALCAILGMATSGFIGAFSAALSHRHGPVNFPKTFSVFSLANMPFIVVMPALFGHVFAAAGDYAPVFVPQIVVLCAAALMATGLAWREGRAMGGTKPAIGAAGSR